MQSIRSAFCVWFVAAMCVTGFTAKPKLLPLPLCCWWRAQSGVKQMDIHNQSVGRPIHVPFFCLQKAKLDEMVTNLCS